MNSNSLGIGSNNKLFVSSYAFFNSIVTSPFPDVKVELETVKPVNPDTYDLRAIYHVQPS